MKLAINECLKRWISRRWLQYVSAFTVTMLGTCVGLHYGWPSSALPRLQSNTSYIHVDNNQASWVASLGLLGDIAGAPLGAITANYIGRRNCLIFNSLPYLACWLLIAFAQNIEIIYFARFLCGVGNGITLTVVPMYVGEIAEDDIRGRLGALLVVLTDFGILAAYIIGYFVNITTNALTSTAFPTIILLAGFFIPESPYFQLMNGNEILARNSLKRFRGIDDVENELQNTKKVVNDQMQNPTSFKELFMVKSNRKALRIIIALRTAQQLTGTAPMLSYTQTIFQKSEVSFSPAILTMLYGLVQMISSVFSSLVIDKVGRRPLLYISCIGTAITLFIQAVYLYVKDNTKFNFAAYNWIPIVTILSYVVLHCFGLDVVSSVMPSELFPTNVKAKALCISIMHNAIMSFAVTKLFQVVSDKFGECVPFFFFTLCCLATILYTFFYIHETKEKSLEDIQERLKGSDVSKRNKNMKAKKVNIKNISDNNVSK